MNAQPAAPATPETETVDPRFSKFPRATLADEIANRVLLLIRSRQLRPGDKLPAERELAQTMGVSRPVLREALRALSLMRVVDIRHGDGTYITSLEPQLLVSHLDFVLATDAVALNALIEARRVVETGNARLAAERISPDGLAGLDRLLTGLKTGLDDPLAFGELDIEFHDAICDAASNVVLSQLMRIVDTMGRVSRQRTGGSRRVRERAYRDHRAILDALRAHDPLAAEAAMGAHLDHIEAALGSATGGPAAAGPAEPGPGEPGPGEPAPADAGPAR